MTKFLVLLESSATIGVKIEIEAEDSYEAEHEAQRLYDAGKLGLGDIVDEYLSPIDFHGHPIIKRLSVEADEMGFEVMDSEEITVIDA